MIPAHSPSLLRLIPLLTIGLTLTLFSTSCRKMETDCSDQLDHCGELITSIDTSLHRKVLIVGIDGVRSDAMQESISPFLFSLSSAQNTYFTPSCKVEELTFSGPNWSSLMTGVHYCKHNVTDNDFSVNSLNYYPHLFHFAEEVDSSLTTASLVNWTPINTHLAQFHSDYAPETDLSDEEVYQAASDLLENADPVDPDLLFVCFDDLDAAGHGYGFSPNVAEYAETFRTIDAYVEALYSLVEDKRTNGENWLFCVISDHGGDGTGHSGGANNPDINQTIFYLNAPDATFMNEFTASQVDLAPTVMAYMGIQHSEFDCKVDGVSLIVD